MTRQCPQTTTFEERGEPKRYRTEVLPLTSLTPYRWAKPAPPFPPPPPPISPSIISLMVSVDVKHHVYLLTYYAMFAVVSLLQALGYILFLCCTVCPDPIRSSDTHICYTIFEISSLQAILVTLCVCLCLSVSLSVSHSLSLTLTLRLCLCPCLCLSVSVSLSLSLSL